MCDLVSEENQCFSHILQKTAYSCHVNHICVTLLPLQEFTIFPASLLEKTVLHSNKPCCSTDLSIWLHITSHKTNIYPKCWSAWLINTE